MTFISQTCNHLPFLSKNKKKIKLPPKLEDYNVVKVLQECKHTKILLCKDLNGKTVVLKKLNPTVRSDLIESEIAAGKNLKHANIVKMVTHFEEGDSIYLVLEYIQGLDLFEYLHQNSFKPLRENEVKHIFKQIIKTTMYIHKKGFVHRDLKLENIMLSANHKVKIIDFGLSATASCGSQFDTFLGSIEYASPEILAKDSYNGCKSETWSLGVLLYALLFGQFPFSATDRSNHFRVNISFPKESIVSEDARDLILHMLVVNQDKRFGIKQVSKHKWIKQ